MKTSLRVRLKFISVCQAQAKNDLTAHYFDKFGARDREEMEESTPHSTHQISAEAKIPLTAPSVNAQPDPKKIFW